MHRHPIGAALLFVALALPMGATGADKSANARSVKEERQCSMPTSPRLQKKGDECAQAKEWARSYSTSDVRSTGQNDTSESLRRLDPRLY